MNSSKIKISLMALTLAIGAFSLFYYFQSKSTSPLIDIAHPGIKQPIPIHKFGFNLRDYHFELKKVGNGDVLGNILGSYGFSPVVIQKMMDAADTSLNLKKIIKGNEYLYLGQKNTDSTIPKYFIYEKDQLEYGVYTFYSMDSFSFQLKIRPQKIIEREVASKIEGSLFETLDKLDVHEEMAMRLSEIFKWSIDFYKIQKNDGFKIIFKERFIEDKSVGIESVSAVYFTHKGKEYHAFYFDKTDAYYTEDGKEMRNMFLKAPIKFNRISSKFTKHRFHPVQKIWKAHLGTDFAAPTGTPIMTTADGVVLEARHKVFNGNYVKIKHDATFTTQYLHMSRIAKGMRPGVRVSQGQVIGYVGSTGLASGPHVCYRFWRNGKQVDALKQDVAINKPLDRKYLNEFLDKIKPLKLKLKDIALN